MWLFDSNALVRRGANACNDMSAPHPMVFAMALGLIDRLRRRRDPVQVKAKEHLYPDHRNLTSRVEKFLDAPEDVQRQVLVELYAVAAMREPGARGPAMLAVVAAITAAGTLLSTFFITLLASALAKTPSDPTTGEMTERSFRALEGLLRSNVGLIIELCVVTLLIAGLVWLFALAQDHERTQARVWLRIYEDALSPTRRGRRNRWPLITTSHTAVRARIGNLDTSTGRFR